MQEYMVFDFDGVLVIPYTNPVKLYPQIIPLLDTLKNAKKYKLYVASFNPTAKKELERLGVLHYFEDVRCGANFDWHHESHHSPGKYLETYRENMSKSNQIKNMIEDEDMFEKTYFFDDDINNIIDVLKNSKVALTKLIDSKHGLQYHHVFFTLDEYFKSCATYE